MALFVVGNLICTLAPSYTVALTGRLIAALCHGAFFGIGSVLAAGMVRPQRAATAVAIMFAGLTTANVLGVPLGTLVGQQYGWRATFAVITVIGLIALAGILLLVPAAGREAGDPLPLRTQAAAFTDRQVVLSLVVTMLVFGGMFGSFTFIEPLERVDRRR